MERGPGGWWGHHDRAAARATTSVRISLAAFDPGRFAEVDAANKNSSEYLIPAIQRLPGLIHYHVAISPQARARWCMSASGTPRHAQQMSGLKEMAAIAAAELDESKAAGTTFVRPIVDHPLSWTPSDGIQGGISQSE